MNLRRFSDQRSEQYKKLVSDIQSLAETEGNDMAQRAIAEAVFPMNETAFTQRENVSRLNKTHVCTARLRGRLRCPDSPAKPCESPHDLPGADHLTEWARDGQTRVITCQPYGIGSLDDLTGIVNYCQKYDLEVSIDAASWWFPGRTIVLAYRRRNRDKDKDKAS